MQVAEDAVAHGIKDKSDLNWWFAISLQKDTDNILKCAELAEKDP